MERLDAKLVNGMLGTSDAVMKTDMEIAQGKIAAVGRPGSLPDAGEVIDIADKGVLPWGIDPHVHSRDPEIGDSHRFKAQKISGLHPNSVAVPDLMAQTVFPAEPGNPDAGRRRVPKKQNQGEEDAGLDGHDE